MFDLYKTNTACIDLTLHIIFDCPTTQAVLIQISLKNMVFFKFNTYFILDDH